MDGELRSLVKVSAILAASMTFARFAASSTKPGGLRLLSLLPVLLLLSLLPWHFSSLHLRAMSAFFLAWLGVFKLLLLAFDVGPLSPSLPLPTFIAVSSLPVKIRPANHKSHPSSSTFRSFIHFAFKAILLACIISLYKYKYTFVPPRCLQLMVYSLHVYIALDVVLGSAAFLAWAFFGLDVEPRFNAPYKATSLQDFWGRRWNLVVTSILRPSVYSPVPARFGPPAGLLATFLVSGLVHEVMFWYMTTERPTGEVTAFFLIHGLCTMAEVRAMRAGMWAPPRAVAVPMTVGFVLVTGFWLFFPPLLRGGVEEKMNKECQAMLGLLTEWGREIFRLLS